MLKDIILEKSRRYKTALCPMGAFVCSAAMTYASLGLASAPLLCAFAGAMSPFCSAAFTIGGIMTLLTSGGILENGALLCSLVLASVGSFIMREDKTARTAAFVTFVSMAFSGVVFGFLADKSVSSAFIGFGVSFLGAAASYFVYETLDTAVGRDCIYADKRILTAFAAVFVLLVSLLCGLTISVINLGIAAACMVTLCGCRFFGCVGGVVCGALTTVGVTAAFPETGLYTVFFGAAGLIAGFASGMNRITITALFSGAVLAGQLAVGMTDISFCIQTDTVLGGMVFLMLPERFISSAGKYFTAAVTDSAGFAGKEMEFTAKSLTDIRKNLSGVITALAARTKPYSMSNAVSEKVCSKCRNKLECWERNFERTNSVFIKMESGKITDINSAFMGFECLKAPELAAEFERTKREATFYKMLSARIKENRELLFAQMEASEQIVMSLSQRMNVNVSKSITSNLCRMLSRHDVSYNNAIAYYNRDSKLIIEIYKKRGDEGTAKELCRMISRELGTDLEYSAPFDCDGETRFRFNQKTKYRAEFISRQVSARNGEMTGDTFCCFTDGLGYAYAFISDGMGSGNRAAIDSELSSKLFKRLIRSGMNCESALKMINSVMLTKSDDESFATLDIGRINLETGSLTLYKSGASATLIKYEDSMVMFALPSNPVGIIHDPVICNKECRFGRGDVLVMMSDGVPETAYPYIKEQLGTGLPYEKIAENICLYSHKITQGTMPDDVTVALVRLI